MGNNCHSCPASRAKKCQAKAYIILGRALRCSLPTEIKNTSVDDIRVQTDDERLLSNEEASLQAAAMVKS